jgi:hypothetical protein
MDGKPIGVARCTSKNALHERFILSFKTGSIGNSGSIVVQLDKEVAEYFEVGDEYVLTFERVVPSGQNK